MAYERVASNLSAKNAELLVKAYRLRHPEMKDCILSCIDIERSNGPVRRTSIFFDVANAERNGFPVNFPDLVVWFAGAEAALYIRR